MKRILGAVLAAALLLLPSTAFAAKPVPSGTIAIADADLVYGGFVTFDVTTEPVNKGFYYTTVVCRQATVVYQWSQRLVLFPSPQTYPFEQQDGLAAVGLIWDQSAPADCGAELRWYERHGKSVTIRLLDSLTFEV